MTTTRKSQQVDGVSLLPATLANLRPLVGRRHRFLLDGKVITRTVEVDTRVPTVERYIARARSHEHVISSIWTVVG